MPKKFLFSFFFIVIYVRYGIKAFCQYIGSLTFDMFVYILVYNTEHKKKTCHTAAKFIGFHSPSILQKKRCIFSIEFMYDV